MPWRSVGWGMTALACLVTGSAILAASTRTARVEGSSSSESQLRNLDIEFYRQRVARDPRSARDYAQLGALHLQRARETADNEDLLRAEWNARHSLRLRTGRNGAAFGVLASSLMAQHRFVEAREFAERLLANDSSSVAARALLAEVHVELGDYSAAGQLLGSLNSYKDQLSVATRLARWQELHGHSAEARRLLRAARERAAEVHGMPAEQLAWFDLRLGDLALRNGHLSEAEQELGKGLAIAPNDYRILGVLARLEANRHRWSRAIDYGERAIASALDPATLGLVGDAYAARGDSGKAREYYHAMEVAVLRQPGPFHRAWSLFLLDHGREVSRVLATVQDEIRSRHDIYGYDLLGWALHSAGDDRHAALAMDSALALGTRDAMLFYHAGMIARARGDQPAAAEYLKRALQVNPYWDPFQPKQARAILDSIAAEADE